jgi:hypothetical protein
MKRFFLLAALGLGLLSSASSQSKKAEEVIKFTTLSHDFGKVKQNVPVTHDFTFKNVGAQPVIIESATASCGCTTPIKPEQPVAKGKTDKIKAGFNAAAPGPFTKSITVKVAGIDLPVELRISGEVLTPEDYAKYESEKNKKPVKG